MYTAAIIQIIGKNSQLIKLFSFIKCYPANLHKIKVLSFSSKLAIYPAIFSINIYILHFDKI